MLAAGEYAPDHEYLAHQGGLGITTRRRNGFVLAVRVVHQLGQPLVEVVVEQRVTALHVVREVGPGEILIVRAGPFTPDGAGLRVGVEACDLGLDLAAELPRELGNIRQEVSGATLHGSISPQKEPGHDGLDCWCLRRHQGGH